MHMPGQTRERAVRGEVGCRFETHTVFATGDALARAGDAMAGARQSAEDTMRIRSAHTGRHLAQSTTRMGLPQGRCAVPRPHRGQTRRAEVRAMQIG